MWVNLSWDWGKKHKRNPKQNKTKTPNLIPKQVYQHLHTKTKTTKPQTISPNSLLIPMLLTGKKQKQKMNLWTPFLKFPLKLIYKS